MGITPLIATPIEVEFSVLTLKDNFLFSKTKTLSANLVKAVFQRTFSGEVKIILSRIHKINGK